ncbi:hypothetical protein [Chryseobacterium vrystaatense]|uniref:hypothetical protein n=1 Tax=Chryseobacterium vrystaatense TaxID=307480 RepID=UPI00158726C5|nr:hypothetical protein [Chryseobacterium vrystaatense]
MTTKLLVSYQPPPPPPPPPPPENPPPPDPLPELEGFVDADWIDYVKLEFKVFANK